jgi:hypothetical protein
MAQPQSPAQRFQVNILASCVMVARGPHESGVKMSSRAARMVRQVVIVRAITVGLRCVTEQSVFWAVGRWWYVLYCATRCGRLNK